ncbi:3'-kinase [Rhizobium sp. LjRoot30]|uniref:aminoglycoside phosphotransferase family protein n=1 Tax=Rhizobium sp. LjRoot30 TaxID=3342320 RepID=UPI003ECC6950
MKPADNDLFLPYLEKWSLVPDGARIVTPSSQLLPVTWHNRPAMLKIAHDAEERFGGLVMKWWQGDGAAKVYEADEDALLIERATGNRSVMRMALGGEDDEATRIMCRTVARLHAPRAAPMPDLRPLEHWFQELDAAASRHGGILLRSAETARLLLADPREIGPLHGDIHHDNILDFEARGWLAIDPKRVYGERCFDYANMLCNPDLPTVASPGRLQRQLAVICAETGRDAKRLLQWTLAFAGLSAAWFLSDGIDPGSDRQVAEIAAAELDG